MSDTKTKAITPEQFEERIRDLLKIYGQYLDMETPIQEDAEYILGLVLDVADVMAETLMSVGFERGVETWRQIDNSHEWPVCVFGY